MFAWACAMALQDNLIRETKAQVELLQTAVSEQKDDLLLKLNRAMYVASFSQHFLWHIFSTVKCSDVDGP